MSGVNYNSYNCITSTPVSFKAEEQGGLKIVKKPIDKVENIVNNTVDTFVPESQNEEKKKSHKTAIRVGSTVLVLSAFVALLNPKFSSSLVNKLKTKSTKAANKAKINNSFLGKWNKVKEKFLNGLTNTIQILNNGNSVKDELFQKLCNKTPVTKSIHQKITKVFDKISRQTVYSKYKNVSGQMNILDDIIRQYKDRLSAEERVIFEQKLKEIDKLQEYFKSDNVKDRLNNQEVLMENLEKDVTKKIVQAKDTIAGIIKGEKTDNAMKLKDTCTFWAEDSLMSERNKIEEQGTGIINSLVGDGKTQKGAYQEMVDLLAKHLNKEEKLAIEDSINQTDKLLRKANKTECVEYFDKKRDLILGSAPTDIVTALFGLTASGIAIGVADSKEDRISRAVTKAFPVIAGLGVSTALTALLFSGGKGIALGAASSMILSAVGSSVNHIIFPKNRQLRTEGGNVTEQASADIKKEVKNA